MNAIVLVIDRLHAGYVGAYGNTWVATPSLDRLAVESVLFDQCLIESPHLEGLCRSYWQGWHPLGPAGLPDDRSALPSLVRAAGASATLLTDEPEVARHPLSGSFDALVELPRPGSYEVADEIDQTHLARCFARLIDWLDSPREPFLLWCHLTGLAGPWDAPLEFRNRYAEADDPDPPDSAEVPCLVLEADYDPDQLLGYTQAYAGQVSLLDVCVGALLEFLDGSPVGQNSLFVLGSARGFPLGEHRRVGPYDRSLYGELVHVPLWIRFPDRLGEAVRSQALVRPADLGRTLLQWWGVAHVPRVPDAASLMPVVREDVASVRDRVCLVAEGSERAIRTPAWHLRDAAEPELFAKPDDRWEVNDVADRCPEVVDLLREAFAEYARVLSSGERTGVRPLENILLTGIE
jgi:arylsulfatase A-like enzyme